MMNFFPFGCGPADPGWRVLLAGCYSAPQGKNYLPHRHRCWEWVYYRAGFIEGVEAGERFGIWPGTLWLTPPGVEHAEIAHTSYSNIFIHVQGQVEMPIPRMVYDDGEGTLGQLCEMLLGEYTHHRKHREEMLERLLGALWISVGRMESAIPVPRPVAAVRSALALWERDPSSASVEETARRIGVSVSYLRSAFHEVEGQSPLAARQLVRLKKALRLLRDSTLTLEAVADLCGYASASHLSRQVRATTGFPPGRLRIGSGYPQQPSRN